MIENLNIDVKADVLIEALPYVNRFQDYIIVIKYGGHAMVNDELRKSVMQDILLMKSVGMHPVIVHGGGPFINDLLERVGKEPEFINGLRVTDKETMTLVEMVLSGQVNNDIVSQFNQLGGQAIGFSGKDANMIVAEKTLIDGIDAGYVGKIVEINPTVIEDSIHAGYVPVISPVAIGEDGTTYNINADTVAGAIASAIQAHKFILLTDVEGIYRDYEDKNSLISQMSIQEAKTLKEQRVIAGGMIPKVACCIAAIENGGQESHIIDGRLKHSLLLELFFDAGIGTMITQD